MVLRRIFRHSMACIFYYIAIERYKLIMSIKFHEAYITTRNNDPVALNLAAFNGK